MFLSMKDLNTNSNQRFKLALKREYYRRMDVNPNYSVRSFARSLGVNDSSLAKIMSGSREPSLKYIRRLCFKLNMSPQQIESMVFKGETELRELTDIDPVIHSDWRFDAILELTYIDGFPFTPQNIASRLNITVAQCKQMIEKLVSSKRLEQSSDGSWKDIIGYYTTNTSSDIDEEYFQRYQVSLSQQSVQSILERPAEDKDHVSMITSIDSDLIDEARLILKRARREILELAQTKSIKKDRVFAVTTNFFDLIEKNKGDF